MPRKVNKVGRRRFEVLSGRRVWAQIKSEGMFDINDGRMRVESFLFFFIIQMWIRRVLIYFELVEKLVSREEYYRRVYLSIWWKNVYVWLENILNECLIFLVYDKYIAV